MQPIKLMASTFYNEEQLKRELCDFIMASEKLSMGSKCLEFEDKFARFQGSRFAVAFNSGSSANLALIQALINLDKLKRGDAVGFSAVTWSTNPMPLIQLGLQAIPVDVDLNNLNVSSKTLEDVLKKTDLKALFITNLLGFCADIERIKDICDQKKILLLEDNCESLGSEVSGKKLGSFGLASTNSTYVGHHLSTVEGGIVCTSDSDLFDMLTMTRAHGWSRNLSESKKASLRRKADVDPFYEQYCFFDLGYNLRPTEITGFLGIRALDFADEIVEKRRANFKRFHEASKKASGLHVLDVDHMDLVSNFAFPVICQSPADMKRMVSRFGEAKVEIRPVVGGNMTMQPFYKKYCQPPTVELTNSNIIHANGFYFPNHPEMEESEVARLVDLMGKTSN